MIAQGVGASGACEVHVSIALSDDEPATAAAAEERVMAAQRGGGVCLHLVDDRLLRSVLSRRLRIVASAACAGLLVMASVAIGGRGWQGGQAELAGAQAETVMVTVPRGVNAGQLFDFDVPLLGEFSAAVPDRAGSGDHLELDVAGQGAPLRSERQVAVRDAHHGPEGIKHVMFTAVVPESALLNNRFTVDIPGRGEVSIDLPPGKLPGDKLSFEMPPPDVKLRPDNRPGMAQIMAVVNRAHAAVSGQLQPSPDHLQDIRFTEPHSGHPLRREQEPQEVRVEVPVGAVGGEILVVKGSGASEFEVTVPGGSKPGSTFLAILPAESAAPKPRSATRSSSEGRTTSLAGEDLADAVTSAVTDAVQDAVQQATTEAAKQQAEEAVAKPAPAPADEATAPEVEAALPVPEAVPPAGAQQTEAEPAQAETTHAAPAEAEIAEAAPEQQAPKPDVKVVVPQSEQTEPVQRAEAEQEPVGGLGHRDGENAFVKGEPIAAQEIPDEYEGEAMLAPDTSTNQYTVTVYEPLAAPGRRNRGIASTWNANQEVLSVVVSHSLRCMCCLVAGSLCLQLTLISRYVAPCCLSCWQAWQFDTSKARAQAGFTWLDKPGVWQEIDAYMVSLTPLWPSLHPHAPFPSSQFYVLCWTVCMALHS